MSGAVKTFLHGTLYMLLGMYELAKQLHFERIRSKSMRVIKHLFPLVIQTTEFLAISHDTFSTVLQAPDLDLGQSQICAIHMLL